MESEKVSRARLEAMPKVWQQISNKAGSQDVHSLWIDTERTFRGKMSQNYTKLGQTTLKIFWQEPNFFFFFYFSSIQWVQIHTFNIGIT